MTDDIRTSILDVIEAYKTRWATPPKPGPLIVPAWFPRAFQNAYPDRDLDALCREYGFDGYQTPVLP